MKRTLATLVIGLSLLKGGMAGASAQDIEKGLEAAKKGDFATALKEWRPLAEQGHARAQYNLGVMYHNGHGVVQDHEEAVKWYRLAAEQGAADAQSNLAVLYGIGRGVVQDYVKAHMWSNIASLNGITNASELRNLIGTRMNAAQIAEAQQLARECVTKNYKGC